MLLCVSCSVLFDESVCLWITHELGVEGSIDQLGRALWSAQMVLYENPQFPFTGIPTHGTKPIAS